MSYSVQIVYVFTGWFRSGPRIYKLLKKKTVRPRPYQVHQVIRLGERPLDHFSFPSGHTLHAVMATTVLGYIQPMLLVLMLPFSIIGGIISNDFGFALPKRCGSWVLQLVLQWVRRLFSVHHFWVWFYSLMWTSQLQKSW